MTPKSITRIVLLAVIAAAVGRWAMKEFGPGSAVSTSGGSQARAGTDTTRPDGVTVINFHGSKRCKSCIRIGSLARMTLDKEFANDERLGKIHWETINYQEPGNAHYINDYQLVSSTILLTLWKNGREVEWNRLDSVWDHVDDEPAFSALVAGSVRDLLTP